MAMHSTVALSFGGLITSLGTLGAMDSSGQNTFMIIAGIVSMLLGVCSGGIAINVRAKKQGAKKQIHTTVNSHQKRLADMSAKPA